MNDLESAKEELEFCLDCAMGKQDFSDFGMGDCSWINAALHLVKKALDNHQDGWEENARYLLDRCPYAVRVHEGGGPEDLLSSFIITFMGMERRLQNNGHST